MHVNGACFCKHIQFDAEIDPQTVTICHCTDCQINSGTAYGVVVNVINEKFHLATGKLKSYIKTADSGRRRELAFCPESGTRIYAKPVGRDNGRFGLRVGTINQRHTLEPKQQIWFQSSLNWVNDLTNLPKN